MSPQDFSEIKCEYIENLKKINEMYQQERYIVLKNPPKNSLCAECLQLLKPNQVYAQFELDGKKLIFDFKCLEGLDAIITELELNFERFKKNGFKIDSKKQFDDFFKQSP